MFSKKIKKVFTVTCCILLLGNSGVLANSQLQGLKEQKQEINKQIEAQAAEISGLNIKVSQVASDIRSLDYQISRSQAELQNLRSQIASLELDIEKNEADLALAKEKLSEKQEELNARLREQYKSGDTIFLEVFMGSSNVVDMLTRLDIVENVVNQDKELLDFTNNQIKFIEETEAKLRIQREEYQAKLDAEIIKKSELENANRQKIQYMSVLQEDKALAEDQYDNFVNLTNSLDQQIVQLEQELEAKRKAEEEARKRAEEAKRRADATASTYVSRGSGELSWPVSGYSSISSYYGMRIHPIFNTQKFHAGIDIPAPSGTAIKAANSGIVIYSGWQGGYGNVVMISHGNNIVTLYAHNSSLNVRVGDYVDAGQTIALCGSTGYSTGPHLHFEVRVNGSTTDPLAWL
ncbi:MAG: peptidoglycan DD-metalloendopeptidase family protein [Tissierellia bacterium]|nr:peptidoglycan DD-metalloendopeptidase family protein [Tissierellia bacterium]